MAIIVEQEKKQTPIFNIAGWLAFLVVAGVAVYYIFFVQPKPAILPATGGLNALAPLTQSAVQPDQMANNPALTALHTTIAVPTSTGPVPLNRQNPFLTP